VDSILHLLLVLFKKDWVDGCGGRSQGRRSNEFQAWVTDELSCQPQEGLLEVIVGLGGDIIVLKVLLAVESNRLRLDFSLLDINLVTGQDNWDVLADTDQVAMPVGDVLVGDSGRDIKHDDAALAVDVVSVAKTTEFLLSCSVPDIELNVTQVRAESERVDFDTKGCDVLLLKLSSQMALDERGLSSSSITNKHKLEGRDVRSRFSHV